MPSSRIEPKTRRASRISIREFKTEAARLLPPNAPLNLVLRRAPDSMTPGELLIHLESWMALIEAI